MSIRLGNVNLKKLDVGILMDFSPLRLSTLRPNRETPFDLFIYFKETYLRYKEAGFSLDDELMKKLKRQKVAKFFISEADEALYQKFLDELLNETLDDPDERVEAKVEMTEGATCNAVEEMQKDPTSHKSYQMTEKAAGSLVKLINSTPEALKVIFDRHADEQDEIIIKHALNVSALASKMARRMKLQDSDIENISVAALVQYIAIPKDDEFKRLFFKKTDELSPQEKSHLDKYAKASAEFLHDKEYVNPNIIKLILHHRENLQGTGPNKLTHLTQAEEILSLINSYGHRVSINRITPKEAFKIFQIDEMGNYSLEMLNVLKDLLIEENMMV